MHDHLELRESLLAEVGEDPKPVPRPDYRIAVRCITVVIAAVLVFEAYTIL